MHRGRNTALCHTGLFWYTRGLCTAEHIICNYCNRWKTEWTWLFLLLHANTGLAHYSCHTKITVNATTSFDFSQKAIGTLQVIVSHPCEYCPVVLLNKEPEISQTK